MKFSFTNFLQIVDRAFFLFGVGVGFRGRYRLYFRLFPNRYDQDSAGTFKKAALYPFTVFVLTGILCSIHLHAASLDSLFSRGDSALAVTWTPDSTNTRLEWYTTNGSACTGADSVYRHCDFIPGETYRSVAYSYGGEDGYLRFREKLSQGFVVGSHLCHYTTFGDPSEAVAGTDCSGFICQLLGARRVSTREFYSQYDVISREELDAGDILVKSGSHAVIVIEKEDADNFLIWESTSVVNGCRERMIDITDTYWDAYSPRRYPGLTTRTREYRPRHEGFPEVTTRNGFAVLISLSPWNGTVSIFDLGGKYLHKGSYHLDGGIPLRISGIPARGTCAVRLSASDGSLLTCPVTLLH